MTGREGNGPLRAVVGLGASAGGVQALAAFLGAAPADAGVAWVIVQHLDPRRETLLSRVLQRVTAMPVRQAEEGQRLLPDTVHVIAPGTSLTVESTALHVGPLADPSGARHPVDTLLTSLAQTFGARGAGVVLSGTGSDGAAGMRALRAAGGLTAAQTPGTAEFTGMPQAALATGSVDLVGAPQELPGLMVAAWRRRGGGTPSGAAIDGEAVETSRSLDAILQLLRQRRRLDLFLYKRSTLLRRIRRRMDIHRLAALPDYERLLAHSDAELDLLAREVLIGVTAFFRDREVWQALRTHTLPALLQAREDGAALRAWVPGCSTGEEAYSLAMAFREALDAVPGRARCTLQIFATDLSADAIDRARRGCYAGPLRGEVSAARLARFFTPHAGGWRVSSEIREMVVFAPHDVNHDPPFTRLDLISCRNLLIYLTAPLQRRLLPLFHYSLRPGGLLLLGSSEAIGRFDDLFETVDGRLKLYRRRATTVAPSVPDFSFRRPWAGGGTPEDLASAMMNDEPSAQAPAVEPSSPAPPSVPATADVSALAERALLALFGPAAVLVNESGDIVYIHGRTGRYLEPAAGRVNWNVHAMARPGLRAGLGEALRRAVASRDIVDGGALPLEDPAGPPAVHLAAHPLDATSGLEGMVLLVFRDVGPGRPAARRRGAGPLRRDLEAELQAAREEAQSLREEMRASQEELQAANEELQSTNEELQSTNEELTSSKEEMQSMNEELQSVNAELQAKLDDLAVAHSDIRNLLNSTDIATLFLDRGLHVRRFTERARHLIRLRDGDVGRPIGELSSSLDYPQLEDDVREMLRTLMPCERQVRSHDGRSYAVRILPYRTQDEVIDGAVLTFMDVGGLADRGESSV